MTVQDKKRLVEKISEALKLNQLDNTLTENGDTYVLTITLRDIPSDGIYHEHIRRIANTTNFRNMKVGQFNLIFIFDISEPTPIVPQ